jgi:hypothetical protein
MHCIVLFDHFVVIRKSLCGSQRVICVSFTFWLLLERIMHVVMNLNWGVCLGFRTWRICDEISVHHDSTRELSYSLPSSEFWIASCTFLHESENSLLVVPK